MKQGNQKKKSKYWYMFSQYNVWFVAMVTASDSNGGGLTLTRGEDACQWLICSQSSRISVDDELF